jgi:nucleotide-binding universal stress UspA family protein
MRVLLAHDGSPGATEATALAGAISWPDDSVLRVVVVIESLFPVAGPLVRGPGTFPDLDAEISAFAEETVRDAVERLRALGRSVEGVILRGRAATALIEQARDDGADLVMVGSRGHGTIASLLLGSVSAEIVDHAPCPVLVARTASLRAIVFATDGSPSAQAAETILASWRIFEGLPTYVVSVAEVVRPWTSGIAPSMYREVVHDYAADLREAKVAHEHVAESAAARLRKAGCRAEVEVRAGDAAAEVIAAADQRGADLVVIGSRGRTGATRLLLGSVARNVLSGSSASVLVVRDHAEEHAVNTAASS